MPRKFFLRLVVIADKNKVHSQFPIPLINRLEKHYVSATSLLTDEQKRVKRELENWAEEFVTPQMLYKLVNLTLMPDNLLLESCYVVEIAAFLFSASTLALFRKSVSKSSKLTMISFLLPVCGLQECMPIIM